MCSLYKSVKLNNLFLRSETCLTKQLSPDLIRFKYMYINSCYLFIEFLFSMNSKCLKDKIVGSSPGWSSPHQINGIDRIISRIRSRNSRNRIIRSIMFILNIYKITSLNKSNIVFLRSSIISGTIKGNKDCTVFFLHCLY